MLSVKNLFVEKENREILKDVSFSLHPNEILCVLGPSGCGKTTLLNSILGFDSPKSGEITFNNSLLSTGSINHVDPFERDFGVVFQELNLFPHLSVSKNIEFGLGKLDSSEARNRVKELIQEFSLENCSNQLPESLSGGERQRVAIARSLAPYPNTIFLDEPFSSLDINTKRNLRVFLKKIFKGLNSNVFMITHDKEDAIYLADKVLVLKNGSVEQFGSPKEVLTQPSSQFTADFFCSGKSLVYENKVIYLSPQCFFGLKLEGEDSKLDFVSGTFLGESSNSSGDILLVDLDADFKPYRGSLMELPVSYSNGIDLNAGERVKLEFKMDQIHEIKD